MWQTLVLVVALSVSAFCEPASNGSMFNVYQQHPAVQRFREYLRIDTSKPENISKAVKFWQRLAADAGLPFAVHEPAGKPVVVITWQGSDRTLPSIMLNSHMDVVPGDPENWSYPPFSAQMNAEGDIFGRGAQDTKDVAITYFEAIRKLRKENVTLSRTFHITLVPDEETGGEYGMKAFVETKEFQALNVGFALDEGMASATNTLYASYVDRRPWQMKFEVHGEAAHGYSMPDHSAMEKAYRLIEVIMKYREKQKSIMESTHWLNFGAYNSININMMEGGIAPNVVPSRLSLVTEMRLSTAARPQEVEAMINSWVKRAGNGTSVTYLKQVKQSAATDVSDANRYWTTMRDAAARLGITIVPIVCPARTDMLYLRSKGIPALGFTTKSHTISRIHGANEYLNAKILLKGIDIYAEIFKNLGKRYL